MPPEEKIKNESKITKEATPTQKCESNQAKPQKVDKSMFKEKELAC